MTLSFLDSLQPDLDSACEAINSRHAKLVGAQLPDGLRSHFRELARYIEARTGATVAMMVDMCCGACMAEHNPEFELILHIAHAELRSTGGAPMKHSRVLFIRHQPGLEVEESVKEAIPMLTAPAGVLTTSTHADRLPGVLRLLKEAGLEPQTATGKRTGGRGIILGCDFSAARKLAKKVNSFLFIGSGAFHPVGAGIATGKPVIGADPYTGQALVYTDIKDRMLRKRFAAMELAKNARIFGILLGLYPGQLRRRKALELKRLLEHEGREAYILAARRFDPENLSHIGMDALVSTACSRIAIDDDARYPIPLLTPPELDIVLGKRDWNDYVLDELG
ncbi:MAG: diphthamide biosynthesis enzyme Dph2 [Euryarchaeota archaeon]|nr:diphthamide biosynthesis enzyme Dph2 [Euryarchaeota archaeon]